MTDVAPQPTGGGEALMRDTYLRTMDTLIGGLLIDAALDGA